MRIPTQSLLIVGIASAGAFAGTPASCPQAPRDAFAADSRCSDTDFRHSSWGMTQAQVIAAESKPPDSIHEDNGETIVQYDSVSVANHEGRLLYIFASGKLVRAKYIFHSSHPDPNDSIRDFRAVDPLLRDTYGKPSYERTFWENDPFQDEGVNYLEQDRALPLDILPSDKFAGIEVSLGYLKLYSQWIRTRTKLVHALTGADRRITHQIEYRSTELAELENTVLRQSAGTETK
jgi:hypothetical protein